MKKHNSTGNAMKNKRLGIRSKLIIAFLVPIAFIVILGIASYSQAKSALVSNAESDGAGAIRVTASYYDLILSNATDSSFSFVYDETLKKYATGIYANDVFENVGATNAIKNKISALTMTSSSLSNIYLLPEMTAVDPIGFKASVPEAKRKEILASPLYGHNLQFLGDREGFDTYFGSDRSGYAFVMTRPLLNTATSNVGVVIFDFDYKAIKSCLLDANLAEGSYISLIVPGGRELSYHLGEDGAPIEEEGVDNYFTDLAILNDAIASTDTEVISYVTYNGTKYLFIHEKCETQGFSLNALIPESSITGSASGIFKVTLILVLLSCIAAILIGTTISGSFMRAIRAMMSGLQSASDGDLTVHVNVNTNDEFLTLSNSINSMIEHVRDLLLRSNKMTEVVDTSSEEVAQSAEVMLSATSDIKTSLAEIDSGITGTANDAQTCLMQMDALATQIGHVSDSATSIAEISESTRSAVRDGLGTIAELKQKADGTIAATASVIESIDRLNESSESIEEIISVIDAIAGQTSLLSLNASIEAARAGEFGRGFSVVASEIRKLADQSTESVQSIRQLVGDIRKQTAETVKVAKDSSEIVNSQSDTLEKTISSFNSIDSQVNVLITDVDNIVSQIGGIEQAKKGTLEAIESISATSEETAAIANNVASSAGRSLDAARSLSDAAVSLRKNSEDLSSAINIFKL